MKGFNIKCLFEDELSIYFIFLIIWQKLISRIFLNPDFSIMTHIIRSQFFTCVKSISLHVQSWGYILHIFKTLVRTTPLNHRKKSIPLAFTSSFEIENRSKITKLEKIYYKIRNFMLNLKRSRVHSWIMP